MFPYLAKRKKKNNDTGGKDRQEKLLAHGSIIQNDAEDCVIVTSALTGKNSLLLVT